MAKARVRLRDVAQLAGVDPSTASRALSASTSQRLSEKTVARVAEAAQQLGYRPNALARGLRTNRTATIGMLVPDLTNPFFPPIVRGIEDELARSGYTLILANTDNDPDRERAVTQSLLARRIDGIILATTRLHQEDLEWIDLAEIPLVLVNRMETDRDLPFVIPDDTIGVREVIAHLADLGHRRIAHVGGPQALSTGRTRYESYCRELADRGLDFEADLVVFAESFGIDAGGKACRELLDRETDLTAIFAANDMIAIGCMDTLRGDGLVVPDDVSLVGYNDVPMVDRLDPPLTTVRVRQYEMGVTAARLILERIEQVGDEVPHVLLPPEFIRRASTAPPRTA